MMTRRETFVGGMAVAAASRALAAMADCARPVLILAPSNLGLRPNGDGSEPGTWAAPAVLMGFGLAKRIAAVATWRLARPAYAYEPQAGTRIRNGNGIRAFSIELGALVSKALAKGSFPVVIGGDCSILLGCLLGARSLGRVGLIHVDGHSDFFHPGNYDTSRSLGAAAGMDLALATGRGEPLLTQWPGIGGPLAKDEDTLQLGERNALDPDFGKYYADVLTTRITRLIIQNVRTEGIDATIARVAGWIRGRRLARTWLHVDLDVLDESSLPAVDSPGSPGLDYDELARLVHGLKRTGSVLGVNFSIYDPERDPDRRYAPWIVDCIARGVGCR